MMQLKTTSISTMSSVNLSSHPSLSITRYRKQLKSEADPPPMEILDPPLEMLLFCLLTHISSQRKKEESTNTHLK